MTEEPRPFKYKVIWEHDDTVEELYALTKEDAEEIKKSIMGGVEYGVYKDSKVRIEPL